ncbi:hypothetical protein PR048_017401 [Dryococelus australis]|uniref:Uncharacterized protein n=1 Tax=Dryococelus australis TaxID=614101 RepID=A0ABQ9HA11_9NEOP|nr:hypothetical protein PR048_017401 [Dryococelus australis]
MFWLVLTVFVLITKTECRSYGEAAVNDFSKLAGMPLVRGAVDATLIKMDVPDDFEPAFVDRHGNHSINVMLFGNEGLEVENEMVGLENVANVAEGQPNDVIDDGIDVLGQETLNYFYMHYEN